MMDTTKFADAVGRAVLARAVKVTPPAVSQAISRGSFPPSWYETGKRLAEQHGIPCPPELFGQRLGADK